jgi:hypothetical protein
MAYFYALIDTHKLQSISVTGVTITVVTDGGINKVDYNTLEEAQQQYDKIAQKIRNNSD